VKNWVFRQAILPFSILALLLGVISALIISAWSNGREQINQKLIDFDHIRSIASFKTLLNKKTELTDETMLDGLFLVAGPAPIVSAQLLAKLKQSAASHEIEVLRVEDLPEKNIAPLTFVGGSLELTGNIGEIYTFIQDIENEKPFLFIEKLDLHSNLTSGNPTNLDTILNVSLRVYGAVRLDNTILKSN
jgi:Type II secretion system (T2SS), protein M subtype b